MKRTLLGGLVLALALFVGHVGTSQAASQNIMYDGFCDGANLTYNVFNGSASGVQTGCSGTVSGPMVGAVANVFSQGPALTMGYDSTATFAASGLFTIIRADHTWTHYANGGGGIVIINSGTWSPGTAVRPNRRGGHPSNVR